MTVLLGLVRWLRMLSISSRAPGGIRVGALPLVSDDQPRDQTGNDGGSPNPAHDAAHDRPRVAAVRGRSGRGLRGPRRRGVRRRPRAGGARRGCLRRRRGHRRFGRGRFCC